MKKQMNFLAFDRLMSGKFKNLLKWTAIYTIVIFIALWLIGWLLSSLGVFSGKWNFIHAFLDLTNPYIGQDKIDEYSISDYVLVVLINLFGLFVLNGVLLTILVNWISNRRERFVMGETRYDILKKSDNLVVIIGGHSMTPRLTRQLYDKHKYDYILIQSRRPATSLRKEIGALMSEEEMAHVVIYAGERTSPLDLAELNLQSAKEIYILGENFVYDGTSHDALNMKCWELIVAENNMKSNDSIVVSQSDESDIKAAPANKIPVHVMFEYQTTFNSFQSTDLDLLNISEYNFIPFNIYEIWAQQVLVPLPLAGENPKYIPLDGGKGLDYNSGQRVHLIIAGMSRIGMALAIEAAHIAHYTNNANPAVKRPRTLITFIDRNARREMQYFMGRFKELFQLARWRYIKAPDDAAALYLGPSLYDSQVDMESENPDFPWTDPLMQPEAGSPFYGIYEPDGKSYLGEDLMDIDWEFIEGDIALPSIQQYIRDAAADNSANFERRHDNTAKDMFDRSSRTTLAVCLPIASEATAAAMCLYDSVYYDAQEILVFQNETGALIDQISSNDVTYEVSSYVKVSDLKYGRMRPFGMAVDCDYLPRIDRTIPKIIAYTYNLIGSGNTILGVLSEYGPEVLSNIIENNWRSITASGPGKSAILMKWSNIYCANAMCNAIRTYGIRADARMMPDKSKTEKEVLEALAYTEHSRWVTEQLLLGISPVPYSPDFRYPLSGEERIILKKKMIHPDIVAYNRLTGMQIYDVEFMRSIPAILYTDEILHNL